MKKYILTFLLFVLPVSFLSAATADFDLAGQRFDQILTYVTNELVTPLFYALDLLAFLVFSYGLMKFVIKADNEQELKKGKEYMLWGIIALFVLVSFTTILGLISGELFGFKIDISNPTLLPTNVN